MSFRFFLRRPFLHMRSAWPTFYTAALRPSAEMSRDWSINRSINGCGQTLCEKWKRAWREQRKRKASWRRSDHALSLQLSFPLPPKSNRPQTSPNRIVARRALPDVGAVDESISMREGYRSPMRNQTWCRVVVVDGRRLPGQTQKLYFRSKTQK